MKITDDILTEFWERIKNKINEYALSENDLNDIFYVNGSETLPPPLSAEEEVDIISRLDKDPSLKTILIERNLRLVVYIAKKFESSRYKHRGPYIYRNNRTYESSK